MKVTEKNEKNEKKRNLKNRGNNLKSNTHTHTVCFYTFDFYYSFEEFPRNLRTCRITLIRMVYFLIESYNRKDIM